MTLGYREALRLPGAVRFTSAAFVARLPIATVGLGLILLVSGVTGSYAQAGILSASYTLSAAIGSIVTSRMADRRGQRRVLPVIAVVNAIGLALIVITVREGAPLWACMAAAALGGFFQPAVGSMVRARWVNAANEARTPELVRPAFALESIIDEVIFTLGPLIAAAASTAIGLGAPLVIAGVLVLSGSWALTVQRRTEPPVHDAAAGGSAVRQRGMPTIAAIAIGVGGIFGAYEVGVVAFCGEEGSPALSGIVLALWAAGSAVGGLWFGSRRWRHPLSTQVLALSAILVVVLLPSLAAPNVTVLILLTTLGGAVVAPTLITVFSMAERVVPARLLTEGLAFALSALTIGFGAGAAFAGFLVDRFGSPAGFGLAVASAGVALVVSAARRRSLTSALQGASDAPDGPPIVPLGDDPISGIAPPRA